MSIEAQSTIHAAIGIAAAPFIAPGPAPIIGATPGPPERRGLVQGFGTVLGTNGPTNPAAGTYLLTLETQIDSSEALLLLTVRGGDNPAIVASARAAIAVLGADDFTVTVNTYAEAAGVLTPLNSGFYLQVMRITGAT
jgi:hypothetical protein